MAEVKPRVLIVDDLLDYLRSLAMSLRRDFEVDTAQSLQEAIARFEEHAPDLCLVDVRLTEEDPSDRSGLDFARWVRERASGVPIIVMSALDDPTLPDRASAVGAAEFLKKPVSIADLRSVLGKHISRVK